MPRHILRHSSHPGPCCRIGPETKNKKPVHYLLLFLIVVAGFTLAESAPARVQEHGTEPVIRYLHMPAGQPVALDSPGWTSLDGKSPNFGYQPEGVHWFRFALTGNRTGLEQKLVEISYPHLDYVTFSLFTDDRLVQSYQTGDRWPFEHRPVAHPSFLFPITLEPEKHYEVLLSVQTQGTVQVPLQIRNILDLFEETLGSEQAHAVYYGILIVIILFNLFVFLALRERVYLYYCLCTFGYLFLVATLRGITYPLLWPHSPWLQNQAMLVAIPMALLFSAIFVRAFLKLPETSPVMNRVAKAMIFAALAGLAGAFVLDYNASIRFSVALAIPGCVLLLLAGPIEWYRGNQAARLYALAWGLLTLGCFITAVHKYGWLPTNALTEYGIQIGSAMEAILLSIALAQRLFNDRQERMAAQEARLREHAERRRAELKLMHQALHHPITGLPNRGCYEMLVKDLTQHRENRRYAVGVIQLLDYTTLHKTLGHNNTDRLIAKAAQRFNRILGEIPGVEIIEQSEHERFYLATLEMSAFAFVLDASTAEQTKEKLDRCLNRLREPFQYLGMELSLAPACGLAIFPDHGTDIGNLIRQAYIAQETANGPGHSLAFYLSDEDPYSAHRLTIGTELKRALATNELALYYQPKLRLSDMQVVGVEALIRWPRRETEVSAEALIAVAEQTGLIKPLTRWVLTQALSARGKLQAAGYDVTVSVNISPNNLREPDLAEFIQALMRVNPSHQGKILLELTETSVMLDPANSLRVLQALVDAGIPISIDDFGSGYSSLSYIKRLPASEIKIDRSLVTELCHQPDDRVIVNTTIGMCHSLGYHVVAEGVEDIETQTLLHRMGCDQIQGYILTRPVPLAQLFEWLAKRSGQTRSRRADSF
ncbi:EAL domain-containing protein [Hydrocarboniclastica marina]|uniref:EAL domain-containing protein n=1 Tax=Hydrocarboniclastica marina TaxID=2259620 RepID=A0A4P7XKA8_9ALTE|nr:EAL domain-containing protein [Hydrocarboniclastica marina]QCF27315.1 EAL domain-containing protein [Hydrocarboniclastica marina]